MEPNVQIDYLTTAVESVNDSYLTIEGEAEAIYKQLSSKFIAYAYHVTSEEQIRRLLDALRKRYYDATHHCYAYRLGHDGASFRANDDGEPSSTAGRPILGQLLSNNLTDCLIVVVRYFGGTKLGVPGLIQAYKESAAAVIAQSRIVSRTVDRRVEVGFSYVAMNDVMRIVKDMQPRIDDQRFDNLCTMRMAIRSSQADELIARLSKVEGATVEEINQ